MSANATVSHVVRAQCIWSVSDAGSVITVIRARSGVAEAQEGAS